MLTFSLPSSSARAFSVAAAAAVVAAVVAAAVVAAADFCATCKSQEMRVRYMRMVGGNVRDMVGVRDMVES